MRGQAGRERALRARRTRAAAQRGPGRPGANIAAEAADMLIFICRYLRGLSSPGRRDASS